MKLNVGCGPDTWGDVRLDVSLDYWMGNSTANIVADAQNLPFKDNSFSELRIHEVLEHLPDWKKALSECCRVTREKLSISVPVDSYLPRSAWITIFHPKPSHLRALLLLRKRTLEHLWQFNVDVLTFLLKKFGFPNTRTRIIHVPVFGFLGFGRKARFFRRLNQRFRLPASWMILAQRSDGD